jgi:hypothetical protein
LDVPHTHENGAVTGLILPREALRRQIAEGTTTSVPAKWQEIVARLQHAILPDDLAARPELVAQHVADAVVCGIARAPHGTALVILRRRAS